MAVMNPANGEVVAEVPKAARSDTAKAIAAARRAFDSGPWPKLTQKERISKLLGLVDVMKQHEMELMPIEAQQGGIPSRKTTLMDIPVGIEMFRVMTELGNMPLYEPLPWNDFPAVSWNFVMREPIGVCGGITAWNFPWLFTMWKTAPALVMGNTVVLKPASYTPLSSLEFAKMVAEADLPPGVVNVVTGSGSTVGAELCDNLMVDKISFTGSTEVGREIQRRSAVNIKRLTLELGGKSAMIVLDDASIDMAADFAIFAAFFNAGQACEAGTRLLVHHKIYDKLMAAVIEKAKLIQVGDTMDFSTTMGPIITESQRKIVEDYIESAHDEGAKLVFGGGRPEGLDQGTFVEPTIFENVTPEMRIFQEEIFGPVLAVTPFKNDGEAVELANNSIYGLGGAVFSTDIPRAIEVARGVRTGTVWVNDYHLLNALCPFGGYKQSGKGHEMSSYALKEYSEIKHIHVDLVGDNRDRKFWLDYVVNR
jgi:aldehyde dehydrogenase (NAD+)